MRILQLITWNRLRGAEVFAALLGDRLIDRDHDARLAALYRVPESGARRLDPRQVAIQELNGRRKGRLEPRMLWQLRSLLGEFRPDVVHANGFHTLKALWALSTLGVGLPPVLYRNISLASRWITRSWQRRWGCRVARTADHVVSVSDASAADFAATYQLDPQLVSTLRRGVPIPAVLDPQHARRELLRAIGDSADGPVLIHVGGMTEEKNHEGLLVAFGEVRRRYPRARLVLCGDGPLRGRIAASLDREGLGESVHMLGELSDAADLIGGADLLVLSSHVEGVPGVVLEASARGIPTVSTDVGGVAEAVRDGETGLLVAPGDMAALAEAAATLIADESQRARLGAAARRLVRQHHDLDRSVDRFLDVYRSLQPSPARARNRNGSA